MRSLMTSALVFFALAGPVAADDEPLTRTDLLAGHGEPGGGSLDIWWVNATVLDNWQP